MNTISKALIWKSFSCPQLEVKRFSYKMLMVKVYLLDIYPNTDVIIWNPNWKDVNFERERYKGFQPQSTASSSNHLLSPGILGTDQAFFENSLPGHIKYCLDSSSSLSWGGGGGGVLIELLSTGVTFFFFSGLLCKRPKADMYFCLQWIYEKVVNKK